MWKTIRAMLPHAAIVLADAFIVFFGIDRVNTAMNFIDHELTKGLLCVMSVIAIADWLIARRRVKHAQQKRAVKRTRAEGRRGA